MHRIEGESWKSNGMNTQPGYFRNYATYREALVAATKMAPGSIVLTSAQGWSETQLLAGVNCRLPQTTMLINEGFQASKIDLILMAASLKGHIVRLERYMRTRCSEKEMQICEDISAGYGMYSGSDLEMIRSHGV